MPPAERQPRQDAVDKALEAGWSQIGDGALAAVSHMEAFIRLGLARLMVIELEQGMDAAAVATGAVMMLNRLMKAGGGVIVLGRKGAPEAAFNTTDMPWAMAQ